eukprot:jgi/Astpho2/3571/Aster-06479
MAEQEAGSDAGADANVMRIGKRVFVSNLAWKSSWQDLKDRFREVGEVRYANVMRDESGRSKGWGIVEFETPEEAVSAVNTFNGTDLAGRKIMVREDREDRDVKQYNRENGIETPPVPSYEEGPRSSGLQVVVQGLPWKYTWKELKPLFEDCGPIARADVMFGRDGRSRGYGTLLFETKEAAQEAINKHHGTDLEGRTLTVKLDKYA